MQRTYMCPYCWQWIDTILDLSIAEQTYLEDCEVCCRPIEIHYSFTIDTLDSFNDNLDNLDHAVHSNDEDYISDEDDHIEYLEEAELRLTCFEVRRENGGEWS